MPEYKNQHYVPKSYLRGWSNSDKLSVYHLETSNEYGGQHVSKICSRSYFNSQTPFLEKWLSKLEGAHASAFNQLRDGSNLRNLSRRERRFLISFSFTQRQRTKLMREEIEASAEEYWDDIISEVFEEIGIDPTEYSNLMESKFEQSVIAVHHMMMMHGILSPAGVADLEFALFHNGTDIDIITSDAPVIFAIPRFKENHDIRYAGMSNQGLQVYCPLGPSLCLFLYDKKSYFVDKDRQWNVTVASEDDIKQLNLLQMLTAESVFYEKSGRQSDMRELQEEAQEYLNPVEMPRKIETFDDEVGEYRYQPHHQLHDLTPSLDSVYMRPRVSFGTRPTSGETRQRFLVSKILERSEYSEQAVATAIQYILQNA